MSSVESCETCYRTGKDLTTTVPFGPMFNDGVLLLLIDVGYNVFGEGAGGSGARNGTCSTDGIGNVPEFDESIVSGCEDLCGVFVGVYSSYTVGSVVFEGRVGGCVGRI